MNTNVFSQITKLSDRELISRVELLAKHEREATVTLVAHLAVLEERERYLGEGCSCLFAYCTQVLHLAEYAAINRMEAARAAQRYPIILEMLAEGSLTLATVRLLIPLLTPSNHRELLEEARHKSKREVEQLVARRRPQAPVPATIRRLPTHTASLVFHTLPKTETAEDQAELPAAPTLEIRPPAKPVVVPLSSDRYKIQFTATKETHELLQRAQALLRHQIPSGDVGEVMTKALRVLVRELEKEKIAATDRPRGSPGKNLQSRHIPAEVKRQVWARDGGACAFVAQNGRRCAERGFLEFHHLVPYSEGGKATIDNIEIRCRAHNGYEATLRLGTIQGNQVKEGEILR